MHPYSLDSDRRRHATVLLGAIAVLAAWALHALLTAEKIDPPWWIEVPGPLAFCAVMLAFFDSHWMWTVGPLPSLTKIPRLDGEWDVDVSSSHESHAVTTRGRATIKQTWSRLVIEFDMAESTSKSLSAAITLDGGVAPELIYAFRNEPKGAARDSMVPFIGTARLSLKEPDLLEGDYFTGRGRVTNGVLTLRRRVAEGANETVMDSTR